MVIKKKKKTHTRLKCVLDCKELNKEFMKIIIIIKRNRVACKYLGARYTLKKQKSLLYEIKLYVCN
jgi:hypothetical protein